MESTSVTTSCKLKNTQHHATASPPKRSACCWLEKIQLLLQLQIITMKKIDDFFLLLLFEIQDAPSEPVNWWERRSVKTLFQGLRFFKSFLQPLHGCQLLFISHIALLAEASFSINKILLLQLFLGCSTMSLFTRPRVQCTFSYILGSSWWNSSFSSRSVFRPQQLQNRLWYCGQKKSSLISVCCCVRRPICH